MSEVCKSGIHVEVVIATNCEVVDLSALCSIPSLMLALLAESKGGKETGK